MPIDIRQGWLERWEIIRGNIMIKYRLLAKRELRSIYDEEREKYDKLIKSGEEPKQLDIKKVLKQLDE